MTILCALAPSACTLDGLTLEDPPADSAAPSDGSGDSAVVDAPIDTAVTDGGSGETSTGVDSGGADGGGDGTVTTDTGAAVDTGTSPVDTGILPVDTGTPPVDTGTVPTDTGTLPTDTGTVVTDTGTVVTDTGVVAKTWDVIVSPGGAESFSPATLTIKVGDSVRWTWQKGGHSVTSGSSCVADDKFCSPSNTSCSAGAVSALGSVYTFKFTTAGTYPYFCDPHCTKMKGTITVTP